MTNKGIIFAALICCVWPLIVHGAILYFTRSAAGIRWDQIRWPWSKHD